MKNSEVKSEKYKTELRNVDKTAKAVGAAKTMSKKAVEKAAKVGKNNASDFMKFIHEQNVVGLAVGLVLGTAASGLVNSLINNVIMPPLGFLLGSADGLRGLTLEMGVTPTGEAAVLAYGAFLNDLINFLVLALVIYLVIKILKLDIKKK